MNLVLHPGAAAQLQTLINNPSHAVLLAAPSGSGKMSVAKHVVAQVLQIEPEKVLNHQYIKIITPKEKSTISIDDVRQLQKFLQLRTTGTSNMRRAVIIEQAEGLTQEAQNALLKILEEPPADTMLLLTASHLQALLPTIRSRVRLINLTSPAKDDLRQHFSQQGHSDENIAKAYFLSGGLPGLMQALLDGDSDHPLAASVIQAKQLLQQSTLEKMAAADRLSKQKDEAYNVIDAMQRIANAALDQAVSKGNDTATTQWHRVQKQSFLAKEALRKNASAKLVLTKLLLHV